MHEDNRIEPISYDYAVIRVVPRVERQEFINVGVIVFCRVKKYLAARIELDTARLRAIAPDADLEEVQSHLDLIPKICLGGADAGPIGQLPIHERFHWLVAPRSTIVQTSSTHSGICTDPEILAEKLMASFIR